MRTFIAIELAEDIRRKLGDYTRSLKTLLGRQSWVKPGNLHITMKFLGEISEEQVPAVINAFDEAVSHFAPFEIGVSGLGCFPSARKPRVIWTGITGDIDILENMKTDIDIFLNRIGFEMDERGFSPHITLARVKSHIDAVVLDNQIQRAGEVCFGTMTVDSVVLMKSVLTPGGAVYSPVSVTRLA